MPQHRPRLNLDFGGDLRRDGIQRHALYADRGPFAGVTAPFVGAGYMPGGETRRLVAPRVAAAMNLFA